MIFVWLFWNDLKNYSGFLFNFEFWSIPLSKLVSTSKKKKNTHFGVNIMNVCPFINDHHEFHLESHWGEAIAWKWFIKALFWNEITKFINIITLIYGNTRKRKKKKHHRDLNCALRDVIRDWNCADDRANKIFI